MRKVKLIIGLLCLLITGFISCNSIEKECPQFNDLNVDTLQLMKNIIFTDGKDSIQFEMKKFSYQNESTSINSFANYRPCGSGYYIDYTYLGRDITYNVTIIDKEQMRVNLYSKEVILDTVINLDKWKGRGNYTTTYYDVKTVTPCLNSVLLDSGFIVGFNYMDVNWKRID